MFCSFMAARYFWQDGRKPGSNHTLGCKECQGKAQGNKGTRGTPLEHLFLQLLPCQGSLLQLLQHGGRHRQLVLGQHAHLHPKYASVN